MSPASLAAYRLDPAAGTTRRGGRHSRGEADEPAAETSAIEWVETDVLPQVPANGTRSAGAVREPVQRPTVPPTGGAASGKPAAEPRPARQSATHADLRMLREDPSLRARCAAGIVVPFVLFLALLVMIGQLDAFLLWVWIPAVTAGVLVGNFLDAAHRERRKRPSR